MKVFGTFSSEIVGLFFLLISATATVAFPGIADFWLALATAITLFLIMYVRLHYGAAEGSRDTTPK